MNFKNEIQNVYTASQYNLKDEESKLKDLKLAFDKAKNNFETVVKNVNNIEGDVYCEKITVFMTESFKAIDSFEKTYENI